MTDSPRIDAHVHFTPPALRDDIEAFAEREPYWGLLLGDVHSHRSIQGWATPERMMRDMDRVGLDRVVVQAEYRQRHEGCVARNDQALELIRRWPERVMAFACIQALAGDRALDELRRCLDGGMCGVGELNPYGQGHSLTHPDFLRLVEACIDHDVPLNLHVNEEVGQYYPGKTTTPLRHYYRLAQRYPELKLILAHWGGGLLFYELMPEVERVMRNVWYDTAASPCLYPTRRIFDVALRCVDHRRILYASDYPLLAMRGQREPSFEPFIREIEELGLDPEVEADVMGRNAARLLGLMEEEETAPPPARRRCRVITEIEEGEVERVTGWMSVTLVAEVWPETREVFERYGFRYVDTPVPRWEPIVQVAAARGYGPQEQQRLLDELNEVIEYDS
ncbi:MAG: amidohydrolase family protein [Armatimonadota bacterium]|nr:amidohydrolase family protein [Armatimonadota bacterium]